jgi:hypothetical protein
MVQKPRDKILAAITARDMTTAMLMDELKLSKTQCNHHRRALVLDKLVEEKGKKTLDRGFGFETIWGLVVAKKAVNAFDWRNWETECHTSKREQAYSVSQFDRRNDGRVIVYSKA